MEPSVNNIQQNYDKRAEENQGNALSRQMRSTIEINSFNNWIKSVLINVHTKQMCRYVEKALDLRRGDNFSKILHVLDIGCGRGQDIKKWRVGRVSYMLATDFSEECLKEYEKRWKDINCPYRLQTVSDDFTKQNLYYQIEHSYYDMVSAQFCFHYMFGNEAGLKTGLKSIFSNLLIGGCFIATIPDSYTILKKIKERGVRNSEGHWTYGNKYFSIRFKGLNFESPFGNEYGFYLQDAVGEKDPVTQQISYVEEWLISLDHLGKMLEEEGMVIEETMNFLEYYLKYRQEYKELFAKFKLNYEPGKHMDPDEWEIGHLYRVLVCRKTGKGKKMSEFTLRDRKKAAMKEIERPKREFNPSRHHHSQSVNESRDRTHSHHRQDNRQSLKGRQYSLERKDYSRGSRRPRDH